MSCPRILPLCFAQTIKLLYKDLFPYLVYLLSQTGERGDIITPPALIDL